MGLSLTTRRGGWVTMRKFSCLGGGHETLISRNRELN